MPTPQRSAVLGQCTAVIGHDPLTRAPLRCSHVATHRAGAQRLCEVHFRGPRMESARVLHSEPFEDVRF